MEITELLEFPIFVSSTLFCFSLFIHLLQVNIAKIILWFAIKVHLRVCSFLQEKKTDLRIWRGLVLFERGFKMAVCYFCKYSALHRRLASLYLLIFAYKILILQMIYHKTLKSCFFGPSSCQKSPVKQDLSVLLSFLPSVRAFSWNGIISFS